MATRRYNTSCTSCRKARLGCDAVVQRPKPCSNCTRRGKNCKSPAKSRSAAALGQQRSSPVTCARVSDGRDIRAPLSPPSSSGNDILTLLDSPSLDILESDASYGHESIAAKRGHCTQLHRALWDVFHSVWDSRATLWFANSCNPFLETPAGADILISRIVLDVDRALEGDELLSPSATPLPARMNSPVDVMLNDCLRYAVYAFACRWLPFRGAFKTMRGMSDEKAHEMERQVRDYFWRRARSSICPALTRPCYRSILALSLMSFTETPMNSDDQAFHHLCCDMLFCHFNRVTQPVLQRKMAGMNTLSEFTTVSPTKDPAASCSKVDSPAPVRERVDHLRNSMFWLAVIYDSQRSLMQLTPSMILPGTSGDAKVWDRIRQRHVIFDQSFKGLRGSAVPLSDDVINVVLQHALACKTMHLGMINQFCDAALHNKASSKSIDAAAQRIQDESNRFHDSLNDLLTLCARDYSAMSRKNQLNYTLILVHYHLGTLILCDICDTLDTIPEQLQDPKLSTLYASTALTNAASLALNYDRYAESDSVYSSILLRDPTPVIMAEAMSRTARGVFSLLEADSITRSTAQIMIAVASEVLEALSQVCETASFAITLIRQSCMQFGLVYKPKTNDSYHFSEEESDLAELLSRCDRGFLDEFIQEMKIVDSGSNNMLLEHTIKAYEEASVP